MSTKKNSKLSYNTIEKFDSANDQANGLPWSGESIRKYIEKNAEILRAIDENRYGAVYFNPVDYTLYAFKSVSDKNKWFETGDASLVIDKSIFSFETEVSRMTVLNRMDSQSLNFATSQDTAEITIGFLSQKKEITASEWVEVVEDALVTVSIDKGGTGTFNDIIVGQRVLYGNDFTFNIRNYIATGTNRVMVTVKGANTESVSTLLYLVNMTTMFLSPSNFAWNTPFIEGEVYNLGGVNIGGALNKKLLVKITNEEGYYRLYEKNIGTTTYITNAYYFTDLEFPSPGTGVYNVELWLDADALESDHLSYNIICVAKEDITTAQLVCISNISSKALNYADNTLFYYSVYNGGAAKATPHVKITAVINTNPIVLKDEDLVNVDTETRLPFNFHLEVETEENDLQLTTLITYGNEQSRNFVIDNSASYPSTAGASFYMNAANRSNSQANRGNIINEVTKGTVACDWTNIAFADGTDGWTIDNEGRKCLSIPAGSTAAIHTQPLASVGNGKTIEINYKVSNVADYNEPIISICDVPSSDSFRGIKILPKKIILHSRDRNTADHVQSYNLMDEEYVNLIITIIRSYKTNYGNIAIIYVNGVKKCEFEFESADSWDVASNIRLGNSSSDLFIYTIRVYESGFGFADSQKNFIGSLNTSKDKADAFAKINNILDDSYNIDYDRVFGIYNTMVIEMLNGAELPHYGLSKEYSANCNLELNILNEDEDKPTISGTYLKTPVSGQGTTSMNYFRWNLRTKKTPIRLTAKKNYASGMQSHKIGACGAYNDLHDLIVGPNEAGARVAVFQYPVLGFKKTLIEGTTDQYSYEFIGLFTIGPDKGDKGTFGYNGEYASTVISMEGTDHSIKGVGFDYPYSEMMYDDEKESICVDRGIEDSEAAWEVSVCGDKSSEADKQTYLDEEFAPAYKCAYDNSVMIMGTSESISTINADVTAWGMRTDASGRPYQHFEFWVDGEYDIYYLSRKTNTYVKNGTNLLTQLGLTEADVNGLSIEEKNELFISKRVERFRESAKDYFNMDDILFSYAFLLIFGASDNFKKNSYPYKLKRLADGGRWCYRQDDMDTIADTDNQGLSTKPYSIEIPDFTDDTKTAYVFKGENSVLVQNVLRAFQPEFKQMGKKILGGMYELSDSGTDTIERLEGFFKKYFWDKAQNYFPKSTYNIDVEYSYEEAWPPYKKGNYVVDVHPLEQAVGDHYEAERDWFINRMIYCSSKFGYGPFAQYNDSSLGVISFRTQLAQDFTLTPAIDLYPTIHSGQSAVLASSERVKAGESVSLNGAGGTNTNVYIKSADLLSDIGDLKTLSVDAANASISVASKRLQRLKIGDENAESVTSNLASVNMGECPSLMLVDARNLKSLTGTFDLSQCPRIREAYFGGTDVRAVTLANGSKITRLQLSDAMTQISLHNLKFLDGTGLETGDLSKVEFFRVENCAKLDAFGMLKELYNAEGSSLKNIRVIGFVYDGDATDMELISNIAQDIDATGAERDYTGIDGDGNPQSSMVPVIEGTLNVNGSVYQDSAEFVMDKYPNLVLNVTGGYYIRFADDNVKSICVSNWGDGIGITLAQAEAVTTLGTKFKGKTNITSFEELSKFTGVTTIDNGAFQGCTALTKIDLTNIKDIKYNAFRDCTVFAGDGNGDLSAPNLETIGYGAFGGYNTIKLTGLKRVLNLGKITDLTNGPNTYYGIFRNQINLTDVVLPDTILKIGNYAFYGCSSLSNINFPPSITEIGNYAFYGCSSVEIEDLSLPELTKVGVNAFSDIKVTTISNLGKVSVIPSRMLYGNTSIRSIDLSNIVTISNGANFKNATSLSIVLNMPKLEGVIPYGAFENTGITAIENLGSITAIQGSPDVNAGGYDNHCAFKKCVNLTSVKLPASLKDIQFAAFAGCTSLTSVYFAEGQKLTTIGNFAFYQVPCSFEVNMPYLEGTLGYGAFQSTGVVRVLDLGNITTVGGDGDNRGPYGAYGRWGAFMDCVSLESVSLPASLTSIQESAFEGCRLLGDINFPSNLQTIEKKAFYGCTSLAIESLSLPSLTTLGQDAFYGVKTRKISNLGEITSLPTGSTNTQNFGDKSVLEEVIFPVTIKTISAYSLWNYSSLKRVSIPSGASGVTIGESVFYGCSSLEELDVDFSCFVSIGAQAFIDVNCLPSELRLTNTTVLGSAAFRGTNISKVYLPAIETLPAVRNYEGLFSLCKNLTLVDIGDACITIENSSLGRFIGTSGNDITIIVRAITPPTLKGYLISPSWVYAKEKVIYVPDESVDAYKGAANWSNYTDIIKPLSEYVE